MASTQVTPAENLAVLAELIDVELHYWTAYMQAVRREPAYASIINSTSSASSSPPSSSDPATDTTSTAGPTVRTAMTTAAAISHILETIPLRHEALSLAYSNKDAMKCTTATPPLFEIREYPALDSLLADSRPKPTSTKRNQKQNDVPQAESEKGRLETYPYLTRRKTLADLDKLDGELCALEEGRMEDLKGLLGLVEDLKILEREGALTADDVGELVWAVDEVGVGWEEY